MSRLCEDPDTSHVKRLQGESVQQLSVGRPDWFYWEDSQRQNVKPCQSEQRRKEAHPRPDGVSPFKNKSRRF